LAAFTKDQLGLASGLSIHEDSDWGRSMSEAFVQAMNRDRQAEIEEVALPLENPEAINKLAERVAAHKPKAIFLGLHARSAVYMVQALSDAGAASPILGTHVLALTDVVPILERLSKNAYVTLPFNPDDPWEAEEQFIKRFSDLHRRFPNWVTAMTYNAVNLAVDAIDQNGDNAIRIRAYLDKLTGPPNTFKGLSGEYFFPTQGQGVGPIFIVPITPSLMGKIP
jgi:ABC-type branched-subunit amino acid transport system substrate-binding protein